MHPNDEIVILNEEFGIIHIPKEEVFEYIQNTFSLTDQGVLNFWESYHVADWYVPKLGLVIPTPIYNESIMEVNPEIFLNYIQSDD